MLQVTENSKVKGFFTGIMLRNNKTNKKTYDLSLSNDLKKEKRKMTYQTNLNELYLRVRCSMKTPSDAGGEGGKGDINAGGVLRHLLSFCIHIYLKLSIYFDVTKSEQYLAL